MVFQSYALYPTMSVRENIGFPLKMRGLDEASIAENVDKVAAILKIEPLLERAARELSGGQRQRVAIGRALVRDPKLFLFDEPLSNLDASLRGDLRAEIKRLHQRIKCTMVYVTHDQIEAMTLATKIVIMNKGVVQQIGTPYEIYYQPGESVRRPLHRFASHHAAQGTGRGCFGRTALHCHRRRIESRTCTAGTFLDAERSR